MKVVLNIAYILTSSIFSLLDSMVICCSRILFTMFNLSSVLALHVNESALLGSLKLK